MPISTQSSARSPAESAPAARAETVESARQVAERTRIEQALAHERELLQAIIDRIPVMITAYEPDTRGMRFNREFERLTGWSAAEAASVPLMEQCCPDAEYREQVRRFMQGCSGEWMDIRMRARNGQILETSWANVLLTDGTRVGIGLDITNRKRAEQQQHRLYTLVQAVNRAQALPDIYEAALEAIQQCLGAERASILFKDARGIMRFKAWRGLSDAYRQAVDGHSPWRPDERNPQPVTIESTADLEPPLREVVEAEGIGALAFIPIRFEDQLLGKFMVYYNQSHRFTGNEMRLAQTIASQIAFAVQRRLSQEELEGLVQERTARLQEMVSELQHMSYAITHDMRAPLRAMNAFATMILEKPHGLTPECQELCRRIVSSAARLDRLILDSLNYTKAVLKELPLQPVDLAKLIPGLIETYPNLVDHKPNIRIIDPLPVVFGEESLLTQCFSNLLGNAVKFVAAGSRPDIRIRVEPKEQLVRVTIEDNGIGFSEQAQQRLFGMFQRLTGEYEGTGIGLAIVRKVVERMGGRVGAESELGKGSRFWVELRPASK